MLFSVEQDLGSTISCYLVPDTGGTVPSVRISSDGVELLTMSANSPREAIVNAGRHQTGMCGFAIDDKLLPGLATYADLEIAEATSGVMVYRRRTPDFIANTKVFRLETHLLPLWRIDEALKPRFQFWYKGIDRQGLETSIQAFCIAQGTSSFISGRLLVKSIEYYLTKGFRSVVVFRDPYDELAERLIILKSITPKTMELLGPRDALVFEPVMNYLAEFEQLDDAACKRFFRRAPEEVLNPLANPFVCQLTASNPGERPSKSSIAPALQVLSDFEIIGLRSEAADFSQALGDMLGVAADTIPVMSEYARVAELGERLRTLRDVEGLLERDLEIYFHTKQAFHSISQS